MGNANRPVTTSKFLPSKVICTGSLPPMNANNNNSSTIIRNDCINTNQCEGTVCRSRVPVLEKAIKIIIGNGMNMAKTGRGGNLLKSEKKPLLERIVKMPTHVTSINVVPKDILFCMFFSQFVLFNAALKPVKIITKQT